MAITRFVIFVPRCKKPNLILEERREKKQSGINYWNSPFLSMRQKSAIAGMVITHHFCPWSKQKNKVMRQQKQSDITGIALTVFVHEATKTKWHYWNCTHSFCPWGNKNKVTLLELHSPFLSMRPTKKVTLLKCYSPFLSMRPKKQSDITGIALTIFVHEANKKSDITEILLTIFVHGAKKKCDHWKMPQSIFPTGKILCKVFFPWEKVFLAKNLATIITVRLAK